MKQFIKKSIVFLLIFLLAYPVLLLLWGYTGGRWLVSGIAPQCALYGYTRSRLQEVKHTADVDVLILGSSHANSGFDTRLFAERGLKAFNLGTSGQTHLQTKMLLQRYLDRLNPKQVIYEVYPVIFTLDGLESGLELVSADKNDTYSRQMVQAVNRLKLYNTWLFALIQEGLGIKDYAEEPVENFTYIPGGFVESRMAFYQPAEYPPVGFEFNKKQWDAFEEIVTMLQERGIEYVLVMTPLTRDYYQSLTGMPGFDKRMEAYGVYYNFNELLHLEDTVCFRDRDHLNQQGVKLFNQALFSILY